MTEERKKQKPQPKRWLRNFYIHGYSGATDATGEITPTRTISDGPTSALGGLDLELSIRTSALPQGGKAVARILCTAQPDGWLDAKIFDLESGRVILHVRAHRDGLPEKKEEK